MVELSSALINKWVVVRLPDDVRERCPGMLLPKVLNGKVLEIRNDVDNCVIIDTFVGLLCAKPEWVFPSNLEGSNRYREIDKANMNKPVAKLQCPRCESFTIQRDDSDHPGSFECTTCNERLFA